MVKFTSFSKFAFGTLLIVFVISLAGISTFAADSQDVNDLDINSLLDQIVLSASKHAETLEEAPANVFVVDRKMIDSYGLLSVGDALSLVPGFYVTDDYSLSQIGVRGASAFGDWNSRVMVLIDGRPTGEQYAGSNSIDNVGLDMDNIERIEVIKGPSSSLYGSNAFFGLINIITIKPDEDELVASGLYVSGTDTKGSSVRLFRRFSNDLSILATGSFSDVGGSDLFFEEFSNPADSSLLALDADGYNQFYEDAASFTGGFARNANTRKNWSTHSQINWREFYMTVHLSSMNTGIAHSMWGSLFNRPENQFKERRHFVDLGYHGEMSESVNLSARIAYDYYTWSDHVLYNYSTWEVNPAYLPGPVWMDLEYNRAVSSEVKLQVDFSETNTAIFGAEVQLQKVRHESGETDESGTNILFNYIPAENIEHNGQIYNAYIQDEHRLSANAKLVGGLHFNYYSYTTGKVMPKMAFIWQPYKNSTYKLIASRGFRSPTFYEITYDDGEMYMANADLEPELIASYDIMTTHTFPYGFSLALSGNYSRMTNLILQTVVDTLDPGHPGGNYLDEISQYRNAGGMESQSVEVSLQRDPIYGVGAFANITYQELHSINEEPKVEPFNSPHWLTAAGLSYHNPHNQFSVSGRLNYMSSRRLWNGAWLGELITADINVTAKNLWRLLNVNVGVTNLLDRDNRVPISYDYAPSTNIQRPGRSVYFKLQTSAGW